MAFGRLLPLRRSFLMATWKILLSDGLEENGQTVLREYAEVADRSGISPDELCQIIGDYDALIVRGRTKVNSAVFAAAAKLKVVGRSGVGVDNIDLNAARASKVTVVNAPIATTLAVAELTLGLMISMMREIPRVDCNMKDGKWLKKELEGAELYQKTLGIIGFGRIGSAVAKRAAAFDMKIVANDPRVNKESIIQQGIALVSLDELYSQADIITLHVPLTGETRSLINAEAIAKMKPGVRIISAARGGIIDESALLAALDAGKVTSAALDVFATEPPGSTPLVNHPRVVCTPHIGAQTAEAQQRAASDISTEVLAALRNETLRWKVA
jgi:D-3-phosphoglycerate dehydrogenase / 2-oxoglutarate reductase